eukprot:CAMPEP_0175043954 /NCGR_PEP_ID=MMETSP0052_2-20121109/3508_1 /TAXON_ID=51329 ORGANISM="Polytomella parva, Strain SAG 63-3" /NCGR_SAMPLE_ID=MMETSP0052_2 /ASSEMBLY_ACC=CAM_ASM_000194 /LENGTH=443 /DNA_ID=CAMNT_0016307139 /DNA_START=88 /DNA_END=1416 /DNA_ORIENTATION=+
MFESDDEDSLREVLVRTPYSFINTQNGNQKDEEDEEEVKLFKLRWKDPKWSLDRGSGYYEKEREKKLKPSLVESGKHAGRSTVEFYGLGLGIWWRHFLRRDFFFTTVNMRVLYLIFLLVIVYYGQLFGWAALYLSMWNYNNSCFIGFHGYRSAFMFATETQNTIGFGTRATGECWHAAMAVATHSLTSLVFDSVILGILFARISHPKQRGRTVILSDCAVVARRNGVLKFMFRVGDVSRKPVTNPTVSAYLFLWGRHVRTAEGERLPCVRRELVLQPLDKTLLLPTEVEHDIDEASPLFGHTLESLEELNAEIVVTLEATTDLGASFMTRVSYLAHEIHWGHTFVSVIHPAEHGHRRYRVDVARFHDVEPQSSFMDSGFLVAPRKLSRHVVAAPPTQNCLPPPAAAINTLVLSDVCAVGEWRGQPALMVRVGDTKPGQVTGIV